MHAKQGLFHVYKPTEQFPKQALFFVYAKQSLLRPKLIKTLSQKLSHPFRIDISEMSTNNLNPKMLTKPVQLCPKIENGNRNCKHFLLRCLGSE